MNPKGSKNGSRGSSLSLAKATPPGRREKGAAPRQGCQNLLSELPRLWHPSGMRMRWRGATGGIIPLALHSTPGYRSVNPSGSGEID